MDRVSKERALDLLRDIQTGFNTWLCTYASDMCGEEDVKAARDRLNHGTLAFIGDKFEQIETLRSFIDQSGEAVALSAENAEALAEIVGITPEHAEWVLRCLALSQDADGNIRIPKSGTHPPLSAGMGDETGWLVECHYPDRIEYVAMDGSGIDWVTDPNKALRCCRRSDAEQLAAGAFDGDDIRVVEHMWTATRKREEKPLSKSVQEAREDAAFRFRPTNNDR